MGAGNNITNLDEYRPHLSGLARCLHCGHEWVSVSPVGMFAGLSCPQCNMEKGVRVGVAYPAEMLECDCGCNVFFASREFGNTCVVCGAPGVLP